MIINGSILIFYLINELTWFKATYLKGIYIDGNISIKALELVTNSQTIYLFDCIFGWNSIKCKFFF